MAIVLDEYGSTAGLITLEDLLKAAVCYAKVNYEGVTIDDWPKSWNYTYWKPTVTLRNLQKAGALIAAAIDKYLNEHK